jgi:hypothetical protein
MFVGYHLFDWYLSRRQDPGVYPVFGFDDLQEITETDLAISAFYQEANRSGTISLTFNVAAVARLLPGVSGADLLTDAALRVIFRNVHLYVRRRSDGAIQWVKLYRD